MSRWLIASSFACRAVILIRFFINLRNGRQLLGQDLMYVVISGISKSTSVLTVFNVLLKSISSSIIKESSGNCPKLLEIFCKELACARRPVGLRSSNFLGFLGFLYLTSLY